MDIESLIAAANRAQQAEDADLWRVRISTLHNETEKISLLNSNTYKGAFLCLVTYSHLP